MLKELFLHLKVIPKGQKAEGGSVLNETKTYKAGVNSFPIKPALIPEV